MSDGASAHITATVTAWPGVEAGPGPRGEWRFTHHGRELGHLHGDHVAHIPLPKSIWRELHDAGRIQEHPVFPGQAGWGERGLRDPEDVEDVTGILRANYERAIQRSQRAD